MEPCVVPSTATPPFFVSEASNVSWKLETEKTGTINCREHTFTSYIEKYCPFLL